jgi:predicted nucleic acid-binding protein
MCEFVQIVSLDGNMIVNSLRNKQFDDFEDCLQLECALSIHADYIITRNAVDFLNSQISVIAPEDF